jgi:hypothetical protein
VAHSGVDGHFIDIEALIEKIGDSRGLLIGGGDVEYWL